MKSLTEKVLSDFNKQYPTYKVLFLSLSGSTLYGTNSENSDVDLKGVFLPSREDVLLKKDPDHWTRNTNNSNEKNSADDVDCQLFSVFKFFNLLEKGETGAVDLLFSAFREDTQLLADEEFLNVLKFFRHEFVPRKMSSFTGYALVQAKRYGVKGTRFKELVEFTDYLDKLSKGVSDDAPCGDFFDEMKKEVLEKQLQYVTFEMKCDNTRDTLPLSEYVVVLGRAFGKGVKFNYLLTRLQEVCQTYGHRAEKASTGVDNKALSHALRVMFEAEELLETGKLVFPLKYADEVKRVKYATDMSQEEYEGLLVELDNRLNRVEELSKTSQLPEKMNRELVDSLLLKFLGE